MASPEKQETVSEKLSESIEETFDKMAKENPGETIKETSVDFEEETEVKSEVVAKEVDGDPETETTKEAVEDLKDEIQDAADSDYNEPAPERWKPEIQEVYNSLPPAARKAMLEDIYKPMQRSYTEATQNLKTMRDEVNPLLETINQYRQDFANTGITQQEAFRTQMAWAAHLQKVGPEQGMRDMSAAYGITAKKEEGQENYLTPTERGFKEQIDALTTQVAGQQQNAKLQAKNQEQERATAYRNEIQSNLNTFINEKTDDGKLAHPHVEKVANGIVGIIKGGLVAKTDEYGNAVPVRAQLLQAYTMACNLDPAVRTPPPSARQAELVDNAQKSQVVTKTPAGHVSTTDDIPTDKFIEKTWEELNRRSA